MQTLFYVSLFLALATLYCDPFIDARHQHDEYIPPPLPPANETQISFHLSPSLHQPSSASLQCDNSRTYTLLQGKATSVIFSNDKNHVCNATWGKWTTPSFNAYDLQIDPPVFKYGNAYQVDEDGFYTFPFMSPRALFRARWIKPN